MHVVNTLWIFISKAYECCLTFKSPVHINSGTGSMEHPNSIIVGNEIEFWRVDIFTSYIVGSIESIIQRLQIIDIYSLSKLSLDGFRPKVLGRVSKHSKFDQIKAEN
jgi:hypothetical protein